MSEPGEFDDIVAELRGMFSARVRGEVPQMEAHWAALRAATETRSHAIAMRLIVHRIAGSAGSFGLPALGAVATPLDEAMSLALKGDDAALAAAVPGWQPMVDRLLDACRAL